MNCPGHCLMFDHTLRSFRDLPMRFADFGVLHRNEISGALTGLTRVRRFTQDDAHIFCRSDQIEQEIGGCLDFLSHVYGIFGYKYTLALSTRPKKFLGEEKQWEQAESALATCLNKFGQPWSVNEGEGAFYGPKIDIQLFDALRRKHQCATIQLDFQLPIRFGLSYKASDGSFQVPVIVHRAILGSVERQFAVLCEHTGGNWPFWLSPRHAIVIPVSEKNFSYAREVMEQIHKAGFYVEFDDSNHQLPKKIREAFLEHHNFLIVVGDQEEQDQTVTWKKREKPKEDNTCSLSECLNMFSQLRDSYQ